MSLHLRYYKWSSCYRCFQHGWMHPSDYIINIIIIYSLEFSHQRKLMVFHWRLSDSKSPQVSMTLLSILAVFNNAVVWMVSTRSPTSKSSRPFNNPLVTVPKAPITMINIKIQFSNSKGYRQKYVEKGCLHCSIYLYIYSLSYYSWQKLCFEFECY